MRSHSIPVFHNLLEPVSLIRSFQQFPPEGFATVALPGDVPAFSASFDLLTTMEPAVRRRVDAFPLARWWRRFLRPNTCFVGSTVSEYALLTGAMEPETFVRELLATTKRRYPFVIIKDLPTEAILVGDTAFMHSRRMAKTCTEAGFVLVEGQALAYVPIDFASTEEFLARLSHARRKNLRRKLRSTSSIEVEEIPTGDARLSEETFVAALYALYLNVYRQSEIHFDLLQPAFFRAVLQDASTDGVLFVYRSRGELIGYNFCVRNESMLIDKYVGFAYPQARDANLYTVSWFHNLHWALTRGLRHYVAGWTDPEVKRSLGARFTFTQHAVYVRNPLVRTLLRPFRRLFESDARRAHS
jgi:hypothetical protein